MTEPAGSASPLPPRFARPQPLGRGAQGETWRAHDTEHDRDVAVKVLDLGQVRDWKAFELFERECKVLRSLDHPSVPRYYEHFSDDEAARFYLVMELVDGRSLARDIADGRRRTTTELTDLLRRLLEVLEYLHELHPRVIHRDIKPGNILVRAGGRPVLVDFGAVARPFSEEGSSTMIGSIGYMAPEQLHGKSGPRSDLYALGATMAAVVAGTEAESLPRRGLVVDLSEVLDPGPLRRTLEAMLQTDPEERPPSARAARALLDAPADAVPAGPTAALATRSVTAPAIPSAYRTHLAVGFIVSVLLAVMTRSPLLLVVGIVLTVARPVVAGLRNELARGDD